VALIVFPLEDPIVPDQPRLTILPRAQHAGRRGVAGQILEAERTWRALHRADARVYVVRTGTPAVGLAALFCSVRQRAFVFSSAGTNDFTFEDFAGTPLRLKLYRFGVRAAQAVVVQTKEQIRLAYDTFPGLRRVVEIASFVELPEAGALDPEAFVWIGRLVPHKQPMEYVKLARALPEARFRMIAVEGNDTPPALAAALRAAAADVPNLDLLAPRSHAEIGDLLAHAVASVSTSEYEGMPNVFLEAWARGVPALSLNVDPDGRIASDALGVSASGSWQRFVDGARDLWNGRADRASLSARTRSYIGRAHSPDSVGSRWHALVEELAAGA
jgi:glycosyltransferase involved in cell wall biosynthesis